MRWDGPPFGSVDETEEEWPNWREETTQLDYPGRDIRIIFEGDRYDSMTPVRPQPADFGDFDPVDEDPDPDVWPLEALDPGYPADVEDLILIANSFPAPNVAWVTEEYLTQRYGYNPVRQSVEVEALENQGETVPPDKVDKTGLVEITATNSRPRRLELTPDIKEALRRIAKIWNGDVVNRKHLLLDKCPDWSMFLGDLDQEELRLLVEDPTFNTELVEAFAEYDWYDEQSRVYLKPQHIARKKVWYSPTITGRKLINNRNDIPSLKGDPNESLKHRFTVGLAAIDLVEQGFNIETYHNHENYTLDVAGVNDDQEVVGEVITDHNNQTLHEKTLKKVHYLNELGVRPIIYFDNRTTAYRIFNFWHGQEIQVKDSNDLVYGKTMKLPRGTFGSEYAISRARDDIKQAYLDDSTSWPVSDFKTTTSLWNNTIGASNFDLTSNQIKSLNW